MTTLTLLASNLRHRSLRTTLLAASLTIAVGFLTVTISIRQKLHEIVTSFDMPYLIVRPVAGDGMLPLSYLNRIREVPGATPVDWYRPFGATDGDRYHFGVLAVNAEFYPGELP